MSVDEFKVWIDGGNMDKKANWVIRLATEKEVRKTTKTAAERVTEAEDVKKKHFMSALGATAVGTIPFSVASKVYGSSLASEILGDYSYSVKNAPGSGRVYRYMKRKYNLKDLKVFRGNKANMLSMFMGPHYLPQTPKINIIKWVMGSKGVHIQGVKDPGILAHEIGHAVDFKRLGSLKSISRYGPAASSVVAINMLRDKEQSKYAPLVAMSGSIPMLYQEGKASIIGLRAIKDSLGPVAAKNSAKLLRKAFGSYMMLPLAAGGGTYLASKLLHKNKENGVSGVMDKKANWLVKRAMEKKAENYESPIWRVYRGTKEWDTASKTLGNKNLTEPVLVDTVRTPYRQTVRYRSFNPYKGTSEKMVETAPGRKSKFTSDRRVSNFSRPEMAPAERVKYKATVAQQIKSRGVKEKKVI